MTPEEMIDLLCEFGHEMGVTKAVTTEEEMYGCKYVLHYKGKICGSDLVSPEFVRDYIARHIKLQYRPAGWHCNPAERGFGMGYGFKIKQANMTEYYTADNGDHVSVTIRPDDTACLMICKAINNALYFQQNYKTRRSAIIAMHRKCGKCEFSSMQRVYVKDGE